MATILIILLCLLAFPLFQSTTVVSNISPRLDLDQKILDAHDSKMLYNNGTFYWYAASYGNCVEPDGNSGCSVSSVGSCGFQLNHTVSLYTSTDLASWVNHGHIFSMATAGIENAILFCPKVIYNKKNDEYVLWFNWIQSSDFSKSYYAIATSKTSTGQFAVRNKQVNSLKFVNLGDFNLFVDSDENAYIIYTSHITGSGNTHLMSIDKLDSNYYEGVGINSGFFGANFVEAPALFKRNNIYYAVFGNCCCYCQAGSPVVVYTSINIMGPWATQNTIGFQPSYSSSSSYYLQGSRQLSNTLLSLTSGQQTDIFEYKDKSGVSQFIYIGDRWQSAEDKLKAHDFTFFYPLSFDNDGNITKMEPIESFTVDL